MLVEASAGTGKTTCLVGRMVNLLRSGRCLIDTLAAVTFSRKSAAELRARFQLGLELEAAAANGEEQTRLITALDNLERCFIGTIHAFCARLIRERPVESSVDPGFSELAENDDTLLREQAWREHVANLIATDDPLLPEIERLGLKISPATSASRDLLTELDELGLEPAELGVAFMQFAEYPDVENWPATPVDLPDLGGCVADLQSYAEHMSEIELPDEFGRDKLLVKYRLIPRMAQQSQDKLDKPAELMLVLEQFREFTRRDLVQKNWLGGPKQALPELDRWNDFTAKHAQPLVLAWREHRYEPVMRAITGAKRVYDRLRRERGALNFQDLLVVSARLLREQPLMRSYFRQRFTHLLIDEFQDTDPIQAEVMMLLTADDGAESDWRKCRPAAGSLFVVGDPKQSIYRFRRADIMTYEVVKSCVKASGGEIVSLTANFRSGKPIIDWINTCFEKVFPPETTKYSPSNSPLQFGDADCDQTVLDDGVGPEEVRVLTHAKVGRQTVRALVEKEAEWIAHSIREAIDEKHLVRRTTREHDQGLPDHVVPSDFLIILRNKRQTTAYARALQRHGLPNAVTGGCILNEVPELRWLHLCVSAIDRNHDPIALVALLRSELFGISDTTLYEFRRQGGRFDYRSPIPEALPAPECKTLSAAFNALQKYANWLRRLPTGAAIEKIAADLGLIASSCAADESGFQSGSLLKAIQLLQDEQRFTVGDYVQALGRLVSNEESHDGVSARPQLEAPVRVMNLHQCKGLEANFVFLVNPSGEIIHPVRVHIDRSMAAPQGFLAVYGRQRSQRSPCPLLAHPPKWDELAAEERRFLDAEEDRLRYVAATRVGRGLTISQLADPEGNRKNPWRSFENDLESVPQFSEPTQTAAQPELDCPSVSDIEQEEFEPAEWDDSISQIGARWKSARKPSYSVASVKATALSPGAKPRSEQKQGAEWGNVLHSLLESLIQQPDTDESSQGDRSSEPYLGLALSLLQQEGLPSSLAVDVVDTANRVLASDVWRRARQASICLAEVPIAWQEPGDGANLPTIHRGVIDLAFREAHGWCIVDYKTERVEPSELPALAEYYRPQIEAYSDAWQRVTGGESVAAQGILFTSTGTFLPI